MSERLQSNSEKNRVIYKFRGLHKAFNNSGVPLIVKALTPYILMLLFNMIAFDPLNSFLVFLNVTGQIVFQEIYLNVMQLSKFFYLVIFKILRENRNLDITFNKKRLFPKLKK